MSKRIPSRDSVRMAINEVMGVSAEDLTGESRSRTNVYARFIYAHCRFNGANAPGVGKELKRARNTADYYIAKYRSEYKYNQLFRTIADAVLLAIENIEKDAREKRDSDRH